MFTTLRVYEMSSGWDDELRKHVEDGFLPELRQLPGFRAYYAIDAGPLVFASVTVFEDRSSAEASNRVAARYAQQHLADRFASLPEVTVGEVVVHATA